MTAFHVRLPATVLAALLLSTAAQAQVSAQQVWDSWKAQLNPGETGELTVGAESYDAGVLSVTGVELSAADDISETSLVIDEITFTEEADGSVSITMSEVIPVSVSTTDATTGQPVDLELQITQTDLEMVATGSAEAIDYVLSATRFAVDMVQSGSEDAPLDMTMVLGLNDLSGTYSTTSGDPMGLTYAMEAASMDLLVDGTDETGAAINLSGKAEGLAMNASGAVPMGAGLTPDMLFAAGLDVTGGYSIGPANFTLAVDDGMAPVNATISMADSLFSFAMNAQSFGFDSNATALAVQVISPDMPFPVTVNLGTYGLGFTMPLSAGEPQPFGARLNLTDLSFNEEIWAMTDPGQVLPRDPATAVITLTGMATMFTNLLDPAAQQEMATTGAPPGQLESLSLDELLVSFGGAQLTGTGSLTFDNTDTTTIPGMPKPTGSIDVAINGANGLMAKLAEMGLIPQDQVMMAQMMLGMFAVPVGDDQLTSTIEFTEDGRILANGQQIQ